MKNKQFNLCITLLAVLLFFSFSQTVLSQHTEPATLDYPNVQRDLDAVKETLKAYEQGDWDNLKAHLAEDAMVYNLGTFDSLTVDQTVAYWQKGRKSATPLIAEDGVWLGVYVTEGPREGKWILNWGNNTLTYPNGETLSFPYHLAARMNEDKVAQLYFYYDNSRIVRGLGYSIDPPLKDDEEEIEDFKGPQENK